MALLCVCDLKATHMNMQYSLIQELMLYKFEVGHNVVEAAKNICWAKSEGTVDHSTITKWFKKFHRSGCKNLDDQVRSGKSKIIYSESLLWIIEAYLANSTWRVSGELDIS